VRELQPDVVHIHLNAKCGLIALAAHLAGVEKIIAMQISNFVVRCQVGYLMNSRCGFRNG
jgi:hypothetical protein